MKKIVINKSYDKFSVSHEAFLRLRELGQQDALKEMDLGAYWPEAATPREPSLNQCGKLIPRDDLKLAQVVRNSVGLPMATAQSCGWSQFRTMSGGKLAPWVG